MELAQILLEWIGTFLLAIEAIKLPNIVRFSNWLRKFADLLNPKVVFVDGENPASVKRSVWRRIKPDLGPVLPFFVIGALLAAAVFVILDVMYRSANISGTVYSWAASGHSVLIVLKILACVLCAIIITFQVGLTAVWLTSIVSRAIVKCLGWLEQRVGSGIVGILGFAILTIAFVIRGVRATLLHG